MNGKNRKKLTTFQIANMLGVSDQSVSNWIDAGQLPAERTPGGHRRVVPDDLIAFLKKQGMRIPDELNVAPTTILIVDDEADVAEWIANILSEKCPDFRVLTAHDGFDAGKIITAELPDLVILDLYMPGLDGFEVCRRIKSDPQTQSIKVIAATAHPSEQAEQAIVDAGAEVYLTKPIEVDQLVSVVGDLLDHGV
jgi:two-component system, OmpR family, response regulator